MTFKLSPSALNLMKDCPRCFWLAQHKVWKRPAGIFPSLPFVMNERNEFQKMQLLQRFPDIEDDGKEIVVLNISNDFCRNDEELERLLRIKLEKEGFL